MNTTAQGTARHYQLLLATIVIGALVVRYLHFSLPLGSDDQVWVTVAKEISTSTVPTDQPVYYTRLVWTWLLILWGHFGSLTLEWVAVLMFALSAMTTVFVAEATRASFDARAALLAALVYAAHPLAVAYDTATLPDGLAVCMLAAVIWLFARYLRAPQANELIIPGLLIGLLFGVKNYFMLVSIPCALTILATLQNWKVRIAHGGALAGAAVGGLALALLLGYASGVEATSHIAGVGDYVDYISQGPATGPDEGFRRVAKLLAERAEVITTLFFGSGAVLGISTMCGLVLSAARARRVPAHLFAASTAVLFLLFLMFMPVRLSPLLFTQLHERYLTVVLPALAISAGVALTAVWVGLGDRALRAAAACVLVAIVGYSAWIPNGMHDRYGTLELRGLERVVAEARNRGTTELLLPAHFRRLVPDSYRDRGAQLRFVQLSAPADVSIALETVAANPSAAIVFFRTPYRMIKEKLRTGDYDESTAYGDFASLMHEARAQGLLCEEVRVPYDTARVWLARIGIETRGQLVGWELRKPAQ